MDELRSIRMRDQSPQETRCSIDVCVYPEICRRNGDAMEQTTCSHESAPVGIGGFAAYDIEELRRQVGKACHDGFEIWPLES